MASLRNASHMLEVAEQAAVAGDLGSADKLLRAAARIQEAELGPLHPDLANTLNNLAIVAEQAGNLGDAEAFYRRSAAIAAAALPAGHQMVVDSRQNLEDFCRARGLPIDAPVDMSRAVLGAERGDDTEREAESIAVDAATEAADAAEADKADRADRADRTDRADRAPAGAAAADDGSAAQRAPLTAGTSPSPVGQLSASSIPNELFPQRGSHSLVWAMLGVAVLAIAALFVWRPWSPRETPAPAVTDASPAPIEGAVSAPGSPAGPPPDTPASPAPAGSAVPPGAPAVSPRDAPAAIEKTERPPVESITPAPSSGETTLTAARLCQSFSTSGGSWQCDAAGDSVVPGSIVLYTRVRSPRDGAVQHRWYRGNALRQSVRLTTRANLGEGYRTYSRHTVDSGADWRVEVLGANGDVLHEQRFAVR